MDVESVVASAISSAGARMIERSRESVVQVRKDGLDAGAGVIWAKEGLVLTNHHVVAGSRGTKVVLHDGTILDARIIRRNRGLDLALLGMEDEPGALPAASAGDSDKLRVGEFVYAIGHPWGRLGTVTGGIVSGLGVVRGGTPATARYVQSDVSLAPGNSGGPLLNARGEVVGINTMIFGRLALSVPSNAAVAWLAAQERRPRLGVSLVSAELPASMRRANQEAPQRGLVIAAVESDSPAAKAGLLVGDVLLGAGDELPCDPGSLPEAIASFGDTVRLRVMRGGRVFSVDVGLRAPGRAA